MPPSRINQRTDTNMELDRPLSRKNLYRYSHRKPLVDSYTGRI